MGLSPPSPSQTDAHREPSLRTNIVAALVWLARCDEALARSRTILERLAGSDSGNEANAWHGHLGSLLELRRFDEFRSAARLGAPVLRKNGLPMLSSQYAALLARRGLDDAAADRLALDTPAALACRSGL